MSTETRLRSAMADAVAPAVPDTELLVSAARRRGLGIRRRRQALGAVGVAAALGLAVMAPTVVAGDGGSTGTVADSVTVGTEQGAFDPSKTSPFTGRSTAAALVYAVGLDATGTAADFRGQGGEGQYPETYAVFRFTPAGGETAGEVGVNVQPDFSVGDTKKATTGEGPEGARTDIAACQDWMQHCTATTLADGSRLTTYEERSDYGYHRGIRRVASLYRADGVRVVASASNGYDVSERDEQITRDEPVLTTDELVAVVTQRWWGPELPTYFTEQGASLKPYDEIGGAATEPTAGASRLK
jgi:hypothetical protein